MEALLKKIDNEYKLYAKDDSCIATTQESPYKRLSKENCDDIFGIPTAEAEYLKVQPNTLSNLVSGTVKKIYIMAFNKAMELNKDKLFSKGDVAYIINLMSIDDISFEDAICKFQSLQQPTEIEVEIVNKMDCMAENPCDERTTFCIICTNTGIPKLDENGCLILKKK